MRSASGGATGGARLQNLSRLSPNRLLPSESRGNSNAVSNSTPWPGQLAHAAPQGRFFLLYATHFSTPDGHPACPFLDVSSGAAGASPAGFTCAVKMREAWEVRGQNSREGGKTPVRCGKVRSTPEEGSALASGVLPPCNKARQRTFSRWWHCSILVRGPAGAVVHVELQVQTTGGQCSRDADELGRAAASTRRSRRRRCDAGENSPAWKSLCSVR